MILLPEAIPDWLPEGHPAHFINDTVDTLDLRAFRDRYEQDGPRKQPICSPSVGRLKPFCRPDS